MIRIFLLACAVAVALPAAADLGGRVVAVHDGDTVSVRAGTRTIRVRLHGIDAPEGGQAHGRQARQALADRVAGREVRVIARGTDGYGRMLGVLRVEGEDVNALQVRDGWAWVFRRYTGDARLLALEAEAKAARRGLWRDAHPVAPWQWRARMEKRAKAALGSND